MERRIQTVGIVIHVIPLIAVAVLLSGTTGSASAELTFRSLEPLLGTTGTRGNALSRNGAHVFGFSGTQACRWALDGTSNDLGFSATGIPLAGVVFSDDGTAIAGTNGPRAFRWTSAEGIQDLGILSGGTNSSAVAISSDGSIVLARGDNSLGNPRSFRWTVADGARDIGVLVGGSGAEALAMSGDGSTVVGIADNPALNRAFHWNVTDGMRDLGDLPGGTGASAHSVSDDGQVVVGGASNAGQTGAAFRWTLTSGMVELPALPGSTSMSAHLVSGNGEVIAGTASTASGPRLCLWKSPSEVVDIRELLLSQGIDLSGWTFGEITGLSRDGSVLLGSGMYQGISRAWVVTGIPAPSVAVPLGFGAICYACRRRRHRAATALPEQ